MADKTYTDDEKRTLRVLKMQEGDLAQLREQKQGELHDLDNMAKRLSAMKERVKSLAEMTGTELPEEHHAPTLTQAKTKERMDRSEIPSWESLEKKADQHHIRKDVVVEDLLSNKEINHAISELERIHNEFAARTGLTQSDLVFLSIATSIQTARWTMMPKIASQLGRSGKILATLSPSAMAMLEQKPDTKELALIDETNEEFAAEAEEVPEGDIHEEPKNWEEILEQKDEMPCNTFDNDPMNWLFGIVNRITGTHTSSDYTSTNAVTGERVSTPGMLAEALRSIKEDPRRLTAAVYSQYAQQRAAQGQPVDFLAPVTEALQPGMESEVFQMQAQQLATMSDLTLIGKQAALPLVINMVVGLLHGLKYNPETDGSRQFYDARTRKIILLSNLMASGSNLAFTIASEQWGKLDIGGLLVSGTRAIQDMSYLINLEDRFIREQMDKFIEQELQDIDKHFKNEITQIKQ